VNALSETLRGQRLRELEEFGLFRRDVSADSPVRVEYSLTEKGRALEPALVEIQTWAERWIGGRSQKRRRDHRRSL
jgi:DNA-binding HxlR family transcriptional regulator